MRQLAPQRPARTALETRRSGRSLVWMLVFAASLAAGTASGYALRVRVGLGESRDSEPDVTTASATRSDPASAEREFQAGYRALQQGRLTEAIARFEKAAAYDPTDPRPHHGIGKANVEFARKERAELAFRRALEADPDFTASLESLSTLLYDRGRYEESLELLDRLERLRPGYPFVLGERALNLIALGRPDAAVPLLEKFNAARGPQAWGLAQLGRALDLSGSASRAEPLYREAIRLDPGFSVARYWLGQLLARSGREEESRKELEAHRRLRDLETEASHLRVLLASSPNDVSKLVALARNFAMRGRTREAIGYLDRAVAVAPDDAKLRALRDDVARQLGSPPE